MVKYGADETYIGLIIFDARCRGSGAAVACSVAVVAAVVVVVVVVIIAFECAVSSLRFVSGSFCSCCRD